MPAAGKENAPKGIQKQETKAEKKKTKKKKAREADPMGVVWRNQVLAYLKNNPGQEVSLSELGGSCKRPKNTSGKLKEVIISAPDIFFLSPDGLVTAISPSSPPPPPPPPRDGGGGVGGGGGGGGAVGGVEEGGEGGEMAAALAESSHEWEASRRTLPASRLSPDDHSALHAGRCASAAAPPSSHPSSAAAKPSAAKAAAPPPTRGGGGGGGGSSGVGSMLGSGGGSVRVDSKHGSGGDAEHGDVGRNKPCPCGLRRKYKLCCGKMFKRCGGTDAGQCGGGGAGGGASGGASSGHKNATGRSKDSDSKKRKRKNPPPRKAAKPDYTQGVAFVAGGLQGAAWKDSDAQDEAIGGGRSGGQDDGGARSRPRCGGSGGGGHDGSPVALPSLQAEGIGAGGGGGGVHPCGAAERVGGGGSEQTQEEPEAVARLATFNAGGFALKMLQKMGYNGGGLGKDGTGIPQAIEAKTRGREGLGETPAAKTTGRKK